MLIRNVLARRVGLALGLCALAAVPASAADNDNGYGYLSAVEGSATLMQAGSGTRTPAELNQPVLAGDRLWVPARSRVEIVLADRNLLRIDGGSEVALESLAGSPDSRDRGTVLRLIEGNLQLVVVRESLGDELPRIDTPNARVYVADYGSFRIAADQEVTEVVVRRGRAEVETDRGTEEVRADEQAYVEGTRIDVERAGAFDTLEHWARRLDEEGNVDSRYLGNDLRYAGSSLSRHGSWVDIQGSHYWRPRVDSSWRPYLNGRWMYTPRGNTWVSYDSWGWVPHHYGSWDYLPAYGWVWQPGHRWAPAWVYWYQGPSYTGWCPTGYYTRYYGSRWGRGSGFHHGVYGWAGGDWGHFNHWTFVPSNYWRGYRQGYRDGRHDAWRDQRNVNRYAVPIDQLRRGGPLGRGLVTTDSRPLTHDVLQDPRRAVQVLTQDPSARRVASRSGGDLPDVNDFVARRPDLPDRLRRAVVSDNADQLDGTPLRPDTLGRGDSGGGMNPDRGRTLRSARRGTDPDREPGQSRVIVGDGGGRSGSSGRSGSGGSMDTPRAGRPSAGDSGGAPRPGAEPQGNSGGGTTGDEPRTGRRRPTTSDSGDDSPRSRGSVVRTEPRDQGNGQGSQSSSDDEPRSGRSARPMPRDDGRSDQGGGSTDDTPRAGSTGRSGRTRPSDSDSSDSDGARPPRSSGVSSREQPGYSRPAPRGGSTGLSRPDNGSSRPEPSDRRVEPRVYERPAPRSTDRGSSERPAPRVYERPSSPSSSRGSYERPSSPSPRVQERPAPPSSSRGGYSTPSRPEPRVEPRSAPPSSSRSGGGGSSARSAPDRGSSDRGTASSSRSGRRGSSRDNGRDN
jgi:hypothetical protein